MNIKYSDALYWAASSQTKKEDYHLTQTQESVLRKLIHYSKTNEKITYSNRVIGQHTFINERVIEKTIPQLNKKGFITVVSFVVSDGTSIAKRRIININWDKIKEVIEFIPTFDNVEDFNESVNEPIQPEPTPQESIEPTQNEDKPTKTKLPKTTELLGYLKAHPSYMDLDNANKMIFEEAIVIDERITTTEDIDKILNMIFEDNTSSL